MMSGLRYLTCSLAAFVVVACSSRALSEENDTSDTNEMPESVESRVLAITDTILQQHIDPPTRQEMILTGVKALYRAKGQTSAKDLRGPIQLLLGARMSQKRQ